MKLSLFSCVVQKAFGNPSFPRKEKPFTPSIATFYLSFLQTGFMSFRHTFFSLLFTISVSHTLASNSLFLAQFISSLFQFGNFTLEMVERML